VRFPAIRRYMGRENILDFEYGTGWFIERLANEGFNVTGIEFLKLESF
jgi:2-polyprenyl-3-methyl-5-hydroxy-6-metoxy-1,4-benzoquinol methylase